MAASDTARRARATGDSGARAAHARDPAPELTELGLAFRRLYRAVSSMRGRDTRLAEGEISHAQFELLLELHDGGELPAGELAAAARMAPGTVTEMLDHLAASGFVERARSDDDRRIVVSRLTALGSSAVERKRASWQERWERALEGVGREELRAAAHALERLTGMFEEASGVSPCEDAQAPVQRARSGPGSR